MAIVDRRVFVVGHRGMLGHVVSRCFAEAGWEIVTSPSRYTAAPRDPLIEQVRGSEASVVINCLGLTKQRSDDRPALYLANAVFPVQLAMRMRPQQYLIHASTDCVFAGVRGQYRVDDDGDATDAYGFSKLLGEGVARLPHVTILRVSVVGPDRGDGRGLLAWFLRQPAGDAIPGYVNHRWNGITTLEWALIAAAYAEEHVRGGMVPRIAQPGTADITKYDLLCAFRDALSPERCVAAVEGPQSVDRTLVPTDRRPPIAHQLRRLSIWYPMHRAPES
jgi:dTDP-4-dehydrorhamnose reductase